MFELIEESKKESFIPITNNDCVNEDFIPLNDIVYYIQISSLERIRQGTKKTAALTNYLTELKKLDLTVMTEHQTAVNLLNIEKNDLLFKIQEESRRRFEAEKKSLSLLKRLKFFEKFLEFECK